MGKKIVITSTVFFLLMLILGFVALREPTRMEVFQDKQDAERIEQGAAVYAENCAICHGEHAKAERCFDRSGQQIGCGGNALNNHELVCGDPSFRLDEVAWVGFKEDYIRTMITIGRPEKGMPAFSEEYRYDTFTAISEHQIEEVTKYILNFETSELCDFVPLADPDWSNFVTDLPAGDQTKGQELYEIIYGCAACHGDPSIEGSNAVGPWSGNFKNLDDRKVGYATADYVYESILNPSAFLAPDCPSGPCSGPPSAMPDNFAKRMSWQDIADIMAYLGVDPQESNRVEIIYPQE